MTGHGHGHGHGPRHGGHHGHGRDHHGNPDDFDTYLGRQLDPERDAWQKPDEVVALLHLRPGAIACDVGAGPGVFTLRLARAVGPSGRVHALDVDPRMLAVLERRVREDGLANVAAHHVPGGRGLPPEPADAVLLVNVLHHFRDPSAYLRELAGRLRPGGRLVNVDFHAGDVPVGPPADQKVSREAFLEVAAEAGLAVAEELRSLPYQYAFALAPA
ncbi:MAG TPA: methyltransferase domain-containing protein [Anaeromyxobacteraceae bacterium]|nr:methyltransferase domain-containing protein [Anaeromyxobacteraceae bacterium]